MTYPRCPICGAPHQTCGPHGEVTPVGTLRTAIKEASVTLDEYHVTINGMLTTALLTPAQAERLGATKTSEGGETPVAAPKGKRRKPTNKSGE